MEQNTVEEKNTDDEAIKEFLHQEDFQAVMELVCPNGWYWPYFRYINKFCAEPYTNEPQHL
jgi:hypothetical protein